MYESLHLADFSLDPVHVCQDTNDKCVLVMICLEVKLIEDIWGLTLLGPRRLLPVDLWDLG